MRLLSDLWNRRGTKLTAVFSVWALLGGVAASKSLPVGSVIEYSSQEFDIDDQGGFSALIDHRERILTAEGARARASHRFSYFETHGRAVDRLEIAAAYTQKPDGRIVRVTGTSEAGPTKVPLTGGLPSGALVFPDVQAGDLLVLRYRVARDSGVFAQQFEDFLLPPSETVLSMRVIYRVPRKFELKAQHSDAWQAAEVIRDSDRSVHTWTYKGPARPQVEPQAVSLTDQGVGLGVSTFGDWSQMALAYRSGTIAAAAAPADTALLQKILRETGADVGEPKDRAMKIANWVRRAIRYVALPLTINSSRPESVRTILTNRYADCKGHVMLTEALLAAAGLDSTPALLNASDSYDYGSVAHLGSVNHVVNYLPALGLFLDTTAKDLDGDLLADALLDKPALLVKTGNFVRTPATQASALISKAKLTYDPTLAWTLSYQAIYSGAEAFDAKAIAEPVAGFKSRYGALLTSGMRLVASDDPAIESMVEQQTDGKPFRTDLRTTAAALATQWDGQRQTTALPLATWSWQGISTFAQRARPARERTQTFVCPSAQIEEHLELHLPDEWRANSLPKNISADANGYRYRARYSYADGVIKVVRSLSSNRTKRVCAATDYPAIRKLAVTMQLDLEEQVVIERTDALTGKN